MNIGNNSLPAIAADVVKLHQDIEHHSKQAIKKAIEAGKQLNEAKGLCGHGNFGGWLHSTGINERSAQRYMKLHGYALNSDMVTDLGGISATMDWLKPVKLPPAGHVLIACDDDHPDSTCPVGVIWKAGRGYHVAVIDIRPEWPSITKTMKAIIPTTEIGEAPIWLTLWLALERKCAGLTFVMAPEHLSPVPEVAA